MLRKHATALFVCLFLIQVPLFSQTGPQVSNLSPASGPVGTVITISGTNFGGTQGSGAVSIGGISAAVGSWTDTVIRATVPAQVTVGSANITVTAGSGSSSNTVAFTVTPGAVFAGPISYTYDELGRLIGVVTASGDAAQYSYDGVGNVLSITRTTSSQPSLFTFTPKSGPVGTQVTIFGANFSPDSTQDAVSFNGTAAAVTSASSTQLVVTVPAGATTGAITVTAPAASVTSASPFTVTSSSGAPRIDSFTPSMAAPGTAITITGANFDPAPANDRLVVNVTPAALPGSVQAASLSMTVPNNAGSGHISLNTPAGTTTSANDLFIPPPGYTVSQLAYTGRAVSGVATTVSVPTANGIGLLLFDGTAGQAVSIVSSAPTFSSCQMQVYAPDATPVGSTASCSSPSFMRVNLATTGTYTVAVLPASGATGSVTVQLATFSDVTGSIVIGTPLTATTTVPGQVARYTFSGTAGQQLSMNLSGNTYTGCNAVVVSVLQSSGTSVGSTGICNGSTGFMDSITLPTTGIYTVLVSPQGTTTGSVTLLLNTFADVTGTISVGTPLTATTTTAGQNALYTFSGTTGQQISIILSGSTYTGCNAVVVSVLKSDGSSLGSTGICNGSTGFVDSLTLPVTGTYTVLVNPQGATTGSITLLLNTFADVTGTISVGTPLTATTTTAGQNALYTFSGTSGQQLSMNLSGNTYVGCNAVVVSVLKSDGTSLAATGICNGSTGFMDSFTLPATDTYTVFVNPQGTTTGSVTLLLNTFADISGTITVGQPLTVTTTGVGQNARYTFSGTSGQQLSMNLSGNTYVGCNAVVVSVLKPDGTSLAATGICNGSTGFMDSFTLPATGTYTVFVNPQGATTGSVTLLLNTFADVTGTISVGTPLTATTTTAGQNALYTFSGTSGQQLSMNLSGNTYVGCNAVVVSVVKPDGTSLASTGICNGSTGFMDSFTLPVTGTYTVLVNPQGTTTGSVTLLINTFTDVSGTISAGTPVTATTTVAGQNARYTFSGTAGQQMSMNFSGNTYTGCNAVVISILQPSGASVGSAGICNNSTGSLNSVTLPVTGTYTVLVDPQGTTTGSVTMLLNNFADVTGTITIGTPLTATTTVAGQNARYTFSGTSGQQLSMNLSGNTYTGCNAVVVSVLQPNGATVGSAGICNGSTGFMDSITLPVTGTYTVLVDPQGTTTGSVTLLLNTFADITGTISTGTSLTATTTVAGQNARYTFSGSVGQQLSMNLSGNIYVGCNAVVVSVLQPNGATVGSAGICNGSTGFMDSITLPVAGTYTVLVNPQGATTGSVTMLLNTFADVAGGAITAGTPVTATTTVAGQNALYTFSGTASQQISMNLSGNTYVGCNAVVVSILQPNGSSVGSAGVCNGSTGFMDSITLPVTGTYTVLVNPQGTTTGSVTLLINSFGDISGTITIGTPLTATTTTAGQNARYTFSGTASQQISMNLSGNTYVGCNAVVVSVLQPNGSSVGSAGVCNGSTGFMDSITLPVTGTYTVLVNPQGTTTGSVTILLNTFADVAGGAISAGTPVTATTTVAGQNALYTFSGTSGQQISMNLSGNTYVGCNAVVVSVLQPNGSSVGSAGVCNGSTGFMDSITLPVTGTYTVLVNPQGTTTGSVTVLLNTFADVTGTISAGTPLTATTTTAGQNARYTFSGTAGQQMSMNLSGNTYVGCNAVVVSVLQPNGSTVGSAGVCNGSTGFMDSITLPVTGTYTALVNPQGTTTGSVTVLLNNFSDVTGTITPGTPITATTTVPGQNALYTFSGTSGQQASLSLSGNTYVGCNAVVVNILKPDGSSLASTGICNGSTGTLNPVALPVSGTYKVFVNPQGTTTGSVTVALTLN